MSNDGRATGNSCRCGKMSRRTILRGAGAIAVGGAGITGGPIISAFGPARASAQDAYEVAVIRWDPADIYFNGVQAGQELERQRIEAEDGVSITFTVIAARG